MKTIKTISLAMVLLLAFSVGAFAQTAATRTATTAAIPTGAGTAVVAVASSTGMTASTTSTPTYLAICDGQELGGFPPCEMMQTVSISGNNVTVRRGQLTTLPTAHASGAIVWYGVRGNLVNGNTTAAFVSPTPVGRCTRASNTILPVINPLTGDISDCILSTTATTDQWMVVNGGQRTAFFPLKRLTWTVAAYTATLTDSIIGVNTNAATTITLPACTGCEGKWYFVMDMSGGTTNAPYTITITPSSGQLVNSSTTASLVPSAVRNQGNWIFYDGTSNTWYIPRYQNVGAP